MFQVIFSTREYCCVCDHQSNRQELDSNWLKTGLHTKHIYHHVGHIEETNIDFHLVISTFYHKNIYIDDIKLYIGGGAKRRKNINICQN